MVAGRHLQKGQQTTTQVTWELFSCFLWIFVDFSSWVGLCRFQISKSWETVRSPRWKPPSTSWPYLPEQRPVQCHSVFCAWSWLRGRRATKGFPIFFNWLLRIILTFFLLSKSEVCTKTRKRPRCPRVMVTKRPRRSHRADEVSGWSFLEAPSWSQGVKKQNCALRV